MKKTISVFLTMILTLTLSACSASETTPETTPTPAASSEPEKTEPAEKTLIAVTSATGTTKDVAEMIAAVTGGDLYEIKAAEPYSDEDLNYSDKNSRSTKEQNDQNARPAIGSNQIDLSGYATIYVGYPIWWGEEPRIMDTFAESYSFEGKTVIPFCTSASSGIGRSGKNLAERAGSGNWLDGRRFDGGVSEDTLRSWIEGLK